MNKTTSIFAAVSCFAISASLAYAEPSAHDMQGARREQWVDRHFKEMDASGDGTITKAEFDGFHTQHFLEIDSNKDGKLSQEEMREGHKEKLEKTRDNRFDEADADHDGTLSPEEAQALPKMSRSFARMDANKDGKLSREEVEAAMKRMRPKRD